VSKKNQVQYVKLIANPGAGKAGELNQQLDLAVASFQKLGIQADVALAKPKEEATPIAERAVQEGYKFVVAMGGDGTIEAVMRGLVGSKTRLGLLPFGTENNVARSLGIPEKADEACELIASGDFRKVDIGQVNIKGGPKTYFWELTVVGLVAALFPEAKKILKGEISKIKDAAETLIQHVDNSKVFLHMDEDSRVKVDTMLVVVSNTPLFGKNFLVAPNASMEDGLLDVSIYPGFTKAELLAYFAAIMDQGYSENEKVQHYRVRKLEIKSKPPMEVNSDAMDLGQGTLKIKCLPGALRVLAPQPADSTTAVEKEPNTKVPAPLSPLPPAEPENEPSLTPAAKEK
jgi:diacylglycerol kinase (ATP)